MTFGHGVNRWRPTSDLWPWTFATIAVALAIVALLRPGGAFALNPERHYEMVSPVYKAGFGTVGQAIYAVSPDGEAVGYSSPGAFAGAMSGPLVGPGYIAHRTANGWRTISMVPPASRIAEKQASDLTPSFGDMLVKGAPGGSGMNPLHEADVLLHATGEQHVGERWELAGVFGPLGETPVNPLLEGSSVDFCHTVYQATSSERFVHEALGLDADELYDLSRGCNGSPGSLSLVGLNNRGTPISGLCDVDLGLSHGYDPGPAREFNAVSADGSEVFFTVCVTNHPSSPAGVNIPHQVFVRLAGSRTVEVSRPVGACGEVPCAGAEERASAEFVGASDDGSRVYFTAPLASSTGPLVPGDDDVSSNLYVASLGCPAGHVGCGAAEREVTSLVEASHDPSAGQQAGVLGVTRIAPDGRRAYFEASGDLLSEAQQRALEEEGRPVPHPGAVNLYVYDDVSHAVAFIGELCSGTLQSGAVEDLGCPGTGSDENLWNVKSNETYAQTAGEDGRFFVFTTYAQLDAGDTNPASDVYRYDALTGSLQRVSLGEAGYDDNGNRIVLGEGGEPLGARIMPGLNGFDTLIESRGLGVRAASEDGSRIVFISGEPLSPLASNGLENAYEWHEDPDGAGGSVSLISSGASPEPVGDVTIAPDGSGVFFVTTDGLVAQDVDGLPDIYDARLGGGFTQLSAPPRPCEGDACQGPLTNPASSLVPGSVSQAPGGNLAPAQNSGGLARRTMAKHRRGGRKKRKGGRRASRPVRARRGRRGR